MPRGRKAKATEEKKADVIVTEETGESAVETAEAAETAETAETVETAEAVEEVKEEAEAPVQEEAEKPAPKKRGRKPGTTKAKAEEKPTPKKRGRKPGTAKTEVKETAASSKEAEANIVLQFDFGEFVSKDLVEKCKEAYKAENKTKIKSIDIYVKPSDKKAYYVVNDKSAGYVDLEN